jgi:hypothetical protein
MHDQQLMSNEFFVISLFRYVTYYVSMMQNDTSDVSRSSVVLLGSNRTVLQTNPIKLAGCTNDDYCLNEKRNGARTDFFEEKEEKKTVIIRFHSYHYFMD